MRLGFSLKVDYKHTDWAYMFGRSALHVVFYYSDFSKTHVVITYHQSN